MAKTQDMTDDPQDVLSRLTLALESLAARQSAGPNEQVGEMMTRLSAALERVSEAQIQGSKMIADETRRAHRPSNEVTPNVSVFNRRGALINAKPKLKCTMMIPWLAEWESLTREEVELLNLLEAGSYVLRRIDDSRVNVTVRVDLNVDGKTPSRLILTHDTAFNNDNFRQMPSLALMLRQLLKQHEPETATAAKVILTDEEEEDLIASGELTVSV